MVRTVMKHEWHRTKGLLLANYGIGAILVLLAAGLAATRWPVISGIGLPLGIAVLSAMFTGVLVSLAVDYWRSSYRRMGYLTQALPVRGRVLFAGKYLYGLLVAVVTTVLCLALGLVLYLGVGGSLENLVDMIVGIGVFVPVWLWMLIPVAILVMLGLYVAQLYFAASIGSESRFQSMGAGGPVVIWLLTYMAVQAAMLVAIIAVPLGIGLAPDGRIGAAPLTFVELIAQGNNATMMPAGFLVGMAVVLPLLLWQTVRSWERRTSLA